MATTAKTFLEKVNLRSFNVYHDYSDLLTLNQIQVQMERENLVVACLHLP